MSFGGLGNAVGYRLYHQVGRARSHLQETKHVSVDILENDESFLFIFDAPGIAAEDIDVRFVDDTIYVTLERYREYREGYRMRFPGRGMTLSAEAPLPEHAIVEPEDAIATVTDAGTLQVELPRALQASEPTDAEATATD